MNKYSKEFQVRNYEADISGKMSPLNILRLLGEMATDHSEHVDIKSEDLIRQNRGWMIYKWRVRMEDYPKIGERFKIETWSSKLFKFYANREFNIYNEKGDIIGRASTLWLYIDMEKRRPIRIPKEFEEKFGVIDEFNFEDFLDIEEDFEGEGSLEYRVRKSDIDSNRHVNNAVYFDWMMENISEKFEKDHFLKEFGIIYKKEIVFGDMIESEIEAVDGLVFNHRIKNLETGEANTFAKTIWERR